jgi:hypothetical protein
MKVLGTVLPTAKSMAASDAYANRVADDQARIAANDPALRWCERRIVGGEVRYYDTTDQYAIVSRQGAVLWFQVTPKGDFRIKTK